jgi:hypothetical protein
VLGKNYCVRFWLSRNALIKKETLSIGLLDKSLIHPREIFSSALENKAANIIPQTDQIPPFESHLLHSQGFCHVLVLGKNYCVRFWL